MNVAEMIEWLKTFPQDAKVTTLEHYTGSGYYDQGGSCSVVDFDNKVDYQQWKDEGDNSPVDYIYGDHFDFYKDAEGKFTLQIGINNK